VSNGLVVGLIAVVAVVVVAALVTRSRRANDGVDSFRRQIDALSQEARRPVIDQVQNAAGRVERDDPADDPGDDPGDDPAEDRGDDPDLEGGPRGA
jgi:hypothetical protein